MVSRKLQLKRQKCDCDKGFSAFKFKVLYATVDHIDTLCNSVHIHNFKLLYFIYVFLYLASFG